MKKALVGILLFLFLCSFTGEWVMYPNPARDHITLEATEGVLPAYVYIYDLQGRLALKKFIGTDLEIAYVEFSLPKGTYVVYLKDK